MERELRGAAEVRWTASNKYVALHNSWRGGCRLKDKLMRPNRKPLPPPRVRREPPTIEEAILAAQGLTDDKDALVEIAAGLMGVTEDEVRPHLARMNRLRNASPMVPSAVVTGKRTVVVERKVSRAPGARPLITLSSRATQAG
jgi:hypothetical protein